jgi:hypothetical protein
MSAATAADAMKTGATTTNASLRITAPCVAQSLVVPEFSLKLPAKSICALEVVFRRCESPDGGDV